MTFPWPSFGEQLKAFPFFDLSSNFFKSLSFKFSFLCNLQLCNINFA